MSITPEDDDSDYINSPPVQYIFTEQENESSLTAITGDRSLTTHDYRCNNLSNAMTDLAVDEEENDANAKIKVRDAIDSLVKRSTHLQVTDTDITSESMSAKRERNGKHKEYPCTRSLGRQSNSQSRGGFDPGHGKHYLNSKESLLINKHHSAPVGSVLVPKNTRQRSPILTFSNIEIRYYERVLGNNVCCHGAPISLGWKHDAKKTIVQTVDDYEYRRKIRRSHRELQLSKFERQQLLINLGYCRKEISAAVRLNLRIKKQRRQTVNNLPLKPMEEILEGAKRKISRLGKRQSSRHLYRRWKKDTKNKDNSGSDVSSTSTLRSSMKRRISAIEGDSSDALSMMLDKHTDALEDPLNNNEVSNSSRFSALTTSIHENTLLSSVDHKHESSIETKTTRQITDSIHETKSLPLEIQSRIQCR